MDRDITIPYLDYRAMMDDIAEYKAIKHEMRYLLKTAEYKKYREDFEFKMEIGEFLSKYNGDYNEILKKIKEEEEKENKE